MATYKQIQTRVKQWYGFITKTRWIANIKHMSGLPMRKTFNRHDPERVELRLKYKVESICARLKRFGMIAWKYTIKSTSSKRHIINLCTQPNFTENYHKNKKIKKISWHPMFSRFSSMRIGGSSYITTSFCWIYLFLQRMPSRQNSFFGHALTTTPNPIWCWSLAHITCLSKQNTTRG